MMTRAAVLPYARRRYFTVNGLVGRWDSLEEARGAAERVMRPIAANKSSGRPGGMLIPNQRVFIFEFAITDELVGDHLFVVSNDGEVVLDSSRRTVDTNCECKPPAYVSGGYCGRCGRVPRYNRLHAPNRRR